MNVPTPQEFQPSLVKALEEAVARLQSVTPHLAPTLANQIEAACADVQNTLKERGEQYGEDLLFLTGERGILVMAVWKSLRMLWSMDNDNPYVDRQDGWRDLAGYAVLCMAMMQYIQDWEAENSKKAPAEHHWLLSKAEQKQKPAFYRSAGDTGLLLFTADDESDSG